MSWGKGKALQWKAQRPGICWDVYGENRGYFFSWTVGYTKGIVGKVYKNVRCQIGGGGDLI